MKRMKEVTAWMLVNKFDPGVYYIGDDDSIQVYELKRDARRHSVRDYDRIARVIIREASPKRKPARR